MAEQSGGFESIATGLNTENLREVLRRTMVMGLPDEEDQRPTFHFQEENTWTKADTEGSPYDWTAVPVTTTPESDVQVLCAYEFFSPLGRQGVSATEVGDFHPNTVVFTMFEDEFDDIEGFVYATVGPGDQRFFFRFWRPASALNDMVVYQVHCVAQGVE